MPMGAQYEHWGPEECWIPAPWRRIPLSHRAWDPCPMEEGNSVLCPDPCAMQQEGPCPTSPAAPGTPRPPWDRAWPAGSRPGRWPCLGPRTAPRPPAPRRPSLGPYLSPEPRPGRAGPPARAAWRRPRVPGPLELPDGPEQIFAFGLGARRARGHPAAGTRGAGRGQGRDLNGGAGSERRGGARRARGHPGAGTCGAGPERRGGFWGGRGHPAADPPGAWVGPARRGRARSSGDGSCASGAGPGSGVGSWRRGRGGAVRRAPGERAGLWGGALGRGVAIWGSLAGQGGEGRGRRYSRAPIGRGALVPPVARRRARAPAPPPGTCPRGVALAPRRPLGASGPRSRRERGRARRAR